MQARAHRSDAADREPARRRPIASPQKRKTISRWSDTRGVTASDGAFRTRGFLGDYDIEVTINGVTKTYPLTLASNTEPAFVNIGKTALGAIAPNGVVNAASFQGGALAPGEIVTIFGSGFGPATLAAAQYTDGQLPTSVGETRVLFDGTPAPMVYAFAGQVSAIAPYSASGTVQVQVEYQGTATPPVAAPVAAAAPGIFTCPNKPSVALAINASAGGVLSCNDDFVPPAPGSVVTFFLTGEGVTTPAIADGRLPAGPSYPAPTAPWTVNIGGIDAPRCAATFAGLVYAGVEASPNVRNRLAQGVSATKATYQCQIPLASWRSRNRSESASQEGSDH